MNFELLLEAEKRGLLPPDKMELLAEARRRGLVGGSAQTAPKEDAQPETGIIEQAGAGTTEGLAGFFGTPSALADASTDLITRGINRVTGLDLKTSSDLEEKMGGPRLGTADRYVQDAQSLGVMPSESPQTGAQRFARRIGQEVGFGVPATATGLAVSRSAQSAPLTFAGANVAADVSAGTAGQTSREVAPDNAALDAIVSLLAGTGAAVGVDRALTRTPPAPTREAVQQQTNDLYGRVEGSGANLTPQAQADFVSNLRNRFAAEGGDPLAYPKANAQLNVIENNPRPSIYGVEQARRRIANKVARSADESAIGQDLIDEVDDYLKNLQPGQIASNSANPEDIVADLLAARASAHTGIKADEVTDAINRAQTRTATTGTAGNSLNAQSQEIRKLYDKEISLRNAQKSGGYTPDEVAAMERIVFPSGGERLLQRVGRMSPATGALQGAMTGFGGGGGIVAALMSGNPAWALAAAPSGAGMVAQSLAERAKAKNIDALVDVILRGGKKAVPQANPGARAAIVSQLLNAPQ